MTVDHSVDTDIIISSQWLLPDGVAMRDTTVATETIGNLEQLHNLIFTPLLTKYEGTYRCTTVIGAQESAEFLDVTNGRATAVKSFVVKSKLCVLVLVSVCMVKIFSHVYSSLKCSRDV